MEAMEAEEAEDSGIRYPIGNHTTRKIAKNAKKKQNRSGSRET
jgi:hypothetical protein